MFLEISQNSQENTCARVSFLIKLQAQVFNFIKKETLGQLFSCEFCEISKNTFLTDHLKEPPSESLQFPGVALKSRSFKDKDIFERYRYTTNCI